MRARLIVNPQAGPDRAPEFITVINDKLRTVVGQLDITIPTGVEDAQRAAAQAVDEGCDALYIAGGDGTLNAALRGLASRGAPLLPVGVIPLGTGNDFAKALGLGEEPGAALDALLEARVIDVDLGALNDRPFANTSAGGFIADVSDSVTETLKNTAGKLAYLVGGARALVGTEPFSARLSIHGDAGEHATASTLDVQLFAVCNARFIGGGYPIAPAALIDDGLLDVLVVPRMPMLQFVGVLQRVSTGQHAGDPAVMHFRAAAFDLEFDRTVRVNTDGEVLDADHCHYRVRHRAACFFCGAQPQASDAPHPWGPDR